MSDIVRGLDANGDWLWGQGDGSYVTNINAVMQNIKTNTLSFLNDCFFDTSFGIDWFNLLGSKNQIAISLAVGASILNTNGVTGIIQLSVVLDAARLMQIAYNAQTVYGATGTQLFQFDLVG